MTNSNCPTSLLLELFFSPPPPLSSIAKKNAPGLANVDDVHTIDTGLPQVGLHVHLEVLGTEVALGRQEHLDVLAGGIENGRQVSGSHLDLNSSFGGGEKVCR